MAYNKFTLSLVKERFKIENQIIGFLPENLPNFAVSTQLAQELIEVEGIGLFSEKSKSEHIIIPVLKELRRKNKDKFSYFSGYEFNVDKKLSLNGFCDFIFSAVPHSAVIESPIICLVEAKKGEVEEGWGQCAAEMYAAKLFNQQHNTQKEVIYGCVTNAFSWCFLKLENNILFIDPNYVPLTFASPHQVLAVLQWILDESLK